MAVPDNRLAHIEKQIVGLEKDVDGASKIADRFEISLEKMTEVSNSIRQLLAVHDSQIRRQHETDLELYKLVDDNKKENLLQHKDIIDLIDKGFKAASEKIEKLDEVVAEKIESCSTVSVEHDRRIRGLERITFIGLGLAMLAGLLIDKIPWDKLF